MNDLRTAAQQFVSDYENGDLGDLKHYARALRAALAQQEPMCVGCEGKPTLQNSPCAVCGKIAQQEQEPVARVLQTVGQYHTGRFVAEVETVRRLRDGESLYTHPPRREWQGLTENEIDHNAKQAWGEDHEIFWFDDDGIARFASALETALKEKNA